MVRTVLCCLGAATTVATLAPAAYAQDEESPFQDKPIVLRVEAPKSDSIQSGTGWPLRFRLRPRDPDQTTIWTFPGKDYPERGDKGAWIFTPLETLQSGEFCSSVTDDCPPNAVEPPYLEFAIDEDYPDRIDDIFAGIRPFRIPEAPRPVYVYQYDPADPSTTTTIKLGPRLSDRTDDGIGYGPNDDLPGFVLLSNVGVGRVLTATQSVAGRATRLRELSPRRAARNLAGMMTHVSMELLSRSGNTVLSTSVQVPRGLFAPTILWDFCTAGTSEFGGPAFECPGPMRFHVDGGPAIYSTGFEPSDNGPLFYGAGELDRSDIDIFTIKPPNVIEVELVAMVVNGTAPTFIDDCNDDGDIDRRDLRCMGYNVISNQVKFTFTQAALFRACGPLWEPWPGTDGQRIQVETSNTFDTGPEQVVVVDFDGINIPLNFPCPTTSGRGSRPPSPP